MTEAVAAGWDVQAQFVAPGGQPVAGAGTVHRLAPGVIEKVATTETPQPMMAIVSRRASTVDVLRTATFVVVADRISDPGNLGTILRSAEASGAGAVVLTPGTVDPTNPKVVRASAGSIFHVPIVDDLPLADLADHALVRLGTSSHLGRDFTTSDLTRRVAIVLGNEAHGLGDDAPVDEWITIPHLGRSESLNVAMAAAVLCFEVARQRRVASGTFRQS